MYQSHISTAAPPPMAGSSTMRRESVAIASGVVLVAGISTSTGAASGASRSR